MATPLDDLLQGAMQRARMGPSIVSAMIVDAANRYLEQALQSFGTIDARAVSVKNKTLWIECLNSAVIQVIRAQKPHLYGFLQTQFGKQSIISIRTRVVQQFTDPKDPSV